MEVEMSMKGFASNVQELKVAGKFGAKPKQVSGVVTRKINNINSLLLVARPLI